MKMKNNNVAAECARGPTTHALKVAAPEVVEERFHSPLKAKGVFFFNE
jgi:hypothetical protein